MISSLRNLMRAPYNHKRPVYALYRFFYWKMIRLLKMKDVKFRLWSDRVLYLNYDSFQSMWIMYAYEVDWEEFNLIRNFVKEYEDVADVGANMGFYTVWFTRFIKTGTVHSFEPDERNFSRLKKNVSANTRSDRVCLNKVALSNKNGMLSFTTGFDGENHIVNVPGSNFVSVRSQTLDDYCSERNIESLSYVKVDIEGFEYDFLLGAERMLNQHKIDILQLEINKTLSNSGRTARDVLNLLSQSGYKLYRYDVKLNEIIEVEYSAERENYLCIANVQMVTSRLKDNSGN